MTKMKSFIPATVATVCMIGLTAGAGYSGSGSHGKHPGKTPTKQTVKQSQREAGSATGTGAGGITESLSASETGAGAPLPEGMGARQFVRSQYTVERVGPEGTGGAAGGSTGTGTDGNFQRGTGETTRDSETERSTGGKVGRESGQTIDQSADDQGTGWMRDRGPGGTVGETGETGDTMDRKSGDTSIGSEGKVPRSGDTTGSGSSANPEIPR